jgi:SAM-dependent methyltransferase
MRTIGDGTPSARTSVGRFFAEPLRDYVLAGLGRPVSVLQAGCLAPLRELGISELQEGGFEVSVSVVDADEPLARQGLRQIGEAYDDVFVGDLRTVPLPLRGFDVVYCGGLLERVSHVELVLDRLTSALRPGGLLLIRVTDRDSALGLLDRRLPGPMRHAIWRRLRPGVPGPFPAVYEQAASERGIASYALMRGLVIAQRSADRTIPARPPRLSSSMRISCAAISRLSKGRYADGHDELLYVIRKPQDRFARVVT